MSNLPYLVRVIRQERQSAVNNRSPGNIKYYLEAYHNHSRWAIEEGDLKNYTLAKEHRILARLSYQCWRACRGLSMFEGVTA